jgi:hypothetical protein
MSPLSDVTSHNVSDVTCCIFQADVVAQTKITYPDQELFQLVYKYLEGCGWYFYAYRDPDLIAPVLLMLMLIS